MINLQTKLKTQINKAFTIFQDVDIFNFHKKDVWLDLYRELYLKSEKIFFQTCTTCYEINELISFCNCKIDNIGITRIELKEFINFYDEIKTYFDNETNLLQETKQTLHHPYFDKVVKNLKYCFHKQSFPINEYKMWMNILKMYIDFIDSRKLEVFYDLYKNNPMFKEYFKFSEQEMTDYERELKEKLGIELYEVGLEKQLEMFANYYHILMNKLFISPSDQYKFNPMAFLNNFYSDNYNKFDKVTGEFLLPTFLDFVPKTHFLNNEYLIQKSNLPKLKGFKKTYNETEK